MNPQPQSAQMQKAQLQHRQTVIIGIRNIKQREQAAMLAMHQALSNDRMAAERAEAGMEYSVLGALVGQPLAVAIAGVVEAKLHTLNFELAGMDSDIKMIAELLVQLDSPIHLPHMIPPNLNN